MAARAEESTRKLVKLPKWLADVVPSPVELELFLEELARKATLLHASNDQLREALREEDDPVLSNALYENLDILDLFMRRCKKLRALIHILNTVPLGDLQLVRCEEDLDDEVMDEDSEAAPAESAAAPAAEAAAPEPAPSAPSEPDSGSGSMYI